MDDSWPFPRLGPECLPLREQEYIQAYLLVLCSELTQDQTERKGASCISHQQSCFSLTLSGVKLANLNENLIPQIVKNCGANVLPWFKVTAKFQVVPGFSGMNATFFEQGTTLLSHN